MREKIDCNQRPPATVEGELTAVNDITDLTFQYKLSNCSVMSRWSAFGLKIIKKLYQKIIKIYALDVVLRHFFVIFFTIFV